MILLIVSVSLFQNVQCEGVALFHIVVGGIDEWIIVCCRLVVMNEMNLVVAVIVEVGLEIVDVE